MGTKLQYDFFFPDETKKTFRVELDSSMHSVIDKNAKFPAWTDLEYKKCSHCPLKKEEHPRCPVATRLSNLITEFGPTNSYDEVMVRVLAPERIYMKKTSIQDGLFGILGLLTATSGCPHMDFLKPMARFHLPFASADETIIRSISFYLLRQWKLDRKGQPADFKLAQLDDLYDRIQKVNRGLLERIKEQGEKDANMNAFTILQTFSSLLKLALSKDLNRLEFLFE